MRGMVVMFIEVEKITEKIKKTEDGTSVANPMSGQSIVDFDIERETIATSDIKSFRKWNKTRAQQFAFKGDLTVVYFRNSNQKPRDVTDGQKAYQPMMIINESASSLSERIGAVLLPSEEGYEFSKETVG